MPLALVAAGLVLVLVGARGTYGDFATTLKGDITGPGNFGYRAAAILLLGVIGYAGAGWAKLSTALMTLMVLGLLVSKDKDFFGQLAAGVRAAPVAAGTSAPTTAPAPVTPPTLPPLPRLGTGTQDNPFTLEQWLGFSQAERDRGGFYTGQDGGLTLFLPRN